MRQDSLDEFSLGHTEPLRQLCDVSFGLRQKNRFKVLPEETGDFIFKCHEVDNRMEGRSINFYYEYGDVLYYGVYYAVYAVYYIVSGVYYAVSGVYYAVYCVYYAVSGVYAFSYHLSMWVVIHSPYHQKIHERHL